MSDQVYSTLENVNKDMREALEIYLQKNQSSQCFGSLNDIHSASNNKERDQYPINFGWANAFVVPENVGYTYENISFIEVLKKINDTPPQVALPCSSESLGQSQCLLPPTPVNSDFNDESYNDRSLSYFDSANTFVVPVKFGYTHKNGTFLEAEGLKKETPEPNLTSNNESNIDQSLSNFDWTDAFVLPVKFGYTHENNTYLEAEGFNKIDNMPHDVALSCSSNSVERSQYLLPPTPAKSNSASVINNASFTDQSTPKFNWTDAFVAPDKFGYNHENGTFFETEGVDNMPHQRTSPWSSNSDERSQCVLPPTPVNSDSASFTDQTMSKFNWTDDFIVPEKFGYNHENGTFSETEGVDYMLHQRNLPSNPDERSHYLLPTIPANSDSAKLRNKFLPEPNLAINNGSFIHQSLSKFDWTNTFVVPEKVGYNNENDTFLAKEGVDIIPQQVASPWSSNSVERSQYLLSATPANSDFALARNNASFTDQTLPKCNCTDAFIVPEKIGYTHKNGTFLETKGVEKMPHGVVLSCSSKRVTSRDFPETRPAKNDNSVGSLFELENQSSRNGCNLKENGLHSVNDEVTKVVEEEVMRMCQGTFIYAKDKDEEDEEELLSIIDIQEEDLMDIIVPKEACSALESIFGRICIEEKNDIDGENIVVNDDVNSEVTNELNCEESNDPPRSISLNMSIKAQAGSCDNSIMYVQTSDHPQKEKKLCCPFCLKTFTKLARHLEMVHKDEAEVREFRNLPKGSKERRHIQDNLRKKGTFLWNTNSKLNNGQLITSRRPHLRQGKTAADYTTCANCVGTYTRKCVRLHTKPCLNTILKGEHTSIVLGRTVEGRISATASDRLRLRVFPVLRDDEIVRLIRYDWLLILYGNKLCLKYTPYYQENLIRARLRLSGRILHALRDINKDVTDFASIYKPRIYDSMIEAVRRVGKFDPIRNEFRAPATASSAVTLLKQVGDVIKFEMIKKDDDENLSKAEKFLMLMSCDISVTINKVVAETQARMRREKKIIMPTDDDVQKLTSYLDRERRKCFSELVARYSFENFVKLASLTMASIIVFNRRRTGETQNILVSDFHAREIINEDTNPQIYATLSKHAKDFVRKYSRMTVRGKKGRDVPVLLDPHVVGCIDLLIKHRKRARIPDRNEFLFALPTLNEDQIKVLDACKLLVDYSLLCGADKPESLRGTSLRKHIATKCISMDLNDNMIAVIANFMGHHEKIHRDYYRVNGIDQDIVKMAELLEKALGKSTKHKNVSDSDAVSGQGSHLGRDITLDDGVDDIDEVSSIVDKDIAAVDMALAEVSADSSDDEYEIPTAKSVRKRKIYSSSDDDDDDGRKPITKRKFSKRRWDPDEVNAVRTVFSMFFENRTLPSMDLIVKQQKSHPSLQQRTWQQIKTYISNQYKSKSK